MKHRGPIITLFAVAALATGLLVMNMRTTAQTQIASQATSPTVTGQAPVIVKPPVAAQPTADSQPPADPPPTADPQPIPGTQPPPAEVEQSAYAGRTSGDEATIAIAVRGSEVYGYICDGKQVEAWLEGTITDGKLTLQGREDAKADGSIQGDAVFGTLWVQGKQWPYAAQRAERPAGLYEGSGTVDGASARVGWIVLPDGRQVGIANLGGVARPAPAIDPYQLSAVQVDGSTIVPRRVDGADSVGNFPS
ncbi:MAG: hypothetical protein ACRDTG_10960 [Pseudonocardiaceae bacterium]